MWPNPVVLMYQIMTDVSLCLLGQSVSIQFLDSENTLHRRVIVAITSTTHALTYAIPPEPLAKLSAAVSRALIRVKQQALRLTALFIGHIQRLDH